MEPFLRTPLAHFVGSRTPRRPLVVQLLLVLLSSVTSRSQVVQRQDARKLSPRRWCFHFEVERECIKYYVQTPVRQCIWHRSGGKQGDCRAALSREQVQAQAGSTLAGRPKRRGDVGSVQTDSGSSGCRLGSNVSAAVRCPCAAQSLAEDLVAFFGAADSWQSLVRQCVSLLSAGRFHPQAGLFVLVPSSRVRTWASQLRSWGVETIELIELDAASASSQFALPRDSAYSSMTLHRQRMPEILGRRGYQFSINLDPDVVCVRAWNLNKVVLAVRGISGRLVRRLDNQLSWLQDLRTGQAAKRRLPVDFAKLLGVNHSAVEQAIEPNGGVLVFNNMRMLRIHWLELGLHAFNRLSRAGWKIEGDQDLISCVIMLNPQVPFSQLPPEYNHGFGRDREVPLGPVVGRRLRHGIFAGALVNAHFVQNGKPWQAQNLSAYPAWLTVARVQYLVEWLEIAYYSVANRTAARMSIMVPLNESVDSRSSNVLQANLGFSLRQQCVCFLRMLHREGEASIMQVLDAEVLAVEGAEPPTPRRLGRRAEIRHILSQRHKLERVLTGSKQAREQAPRFRCPRRERGTARAQWKREVGG